MDYDEPMDLGLQHHCSTSLRYPNFGRGGYLEVSRVWVEPRFHKKKKAMAEAKR